MVISPPFPASLIERLEEASRTARRTCARARRKKRWRLAKLLPPGFNRRSMMFMGGPTLPGLFDAHVPLDQPADLPLGVAALGHAQDELLVLLLALAVLLRAERDHRQQILDL